MLAEETIRLQAFCLPKRGTRKLAPNVGVLCYPKKVAVVVGGRSPWGQSIERKRLTHRYKLRCPSCGGWWRVLYLRPGARRFLCRRCADVTAYAVWKRDGYYRQPQRPDAWLRWFEARSRKVLDLEPKGGEPILAEAVRWVYEEARKAPGEAQFKEALIRKLAELLAPVFTAAKAGDSEAQALLRTLAAASGKREEETEEALKRWFGAEET